MNEAQIRRYAELMREMDLSGFEMTEDNQKVRLERAWAGAPAGMNHYVPVSERDGSSKSETAAEIKADEADYVSITSPVVGVFYASSAENADPYVAVGDEVTKGQTVCLIEAMKLMTEIQAEAEGTITEVCAANGQVVEYGTELFRVRRRA